MAAQVCSRCDLDLQGVVHITHLFCNGELLFLFCGRTCAYIFSTGLDILEQNGHGPGELRAMPHQVQRQPSACFLERSDDGEPYLIISGTGRQPISSRKCCDFCESEPCLALHELQQLRQLPSLSHPTPTAQVQSSTRPFVASGRGSGHLLRQEQAAAWTNDTRCRPCLLLLGRVVVADKRMPDHLRAGRDGLPVRPHHARHVAAPSTATGLEMGMGRPGVWPRTRLHGSVWLWTKMSDQN